jgi:predicted NAD/FAD-binding protein
MATAATTRVTTVAVRVRDVDRVAREAGLHPELVARLVRLGFAEIDAVDAAAQLARAVRLRRDLGLNYAGALLATELLARIDDLQERLRRYER